MAKFSRLCDILLVVLSLFSLTTHFSYAYLDPSSGSYILQMGLASLFGALFVVKAFWSQIRSFISDKILRRSATKQST